MHTGLLRDGIAKGGVASCGYLTAVGRGRLLRSHLLVRFPVLFLCGITLAAEVSTLVSEARIVQNEGLISCEDRLGPLGVA